MGTVLLFNISNPEKMTAIRLLALRLGLHCLEVSPAQQGLPLELLLSGSVNESGSCVAPFTDEMMILHALSGETFHTFLDALRINGQSVRLKAIVTEHNRSWTADRLHREISAEAEAMARQKPPARSGSKKKGRR